MGLAEIIRGKAEGRALTAEQSALFMSAYLGGELSDAEATSLLAGIFHRGMEPEELFGWTQAMLESGERLQFDDAGGPVVDKHSTGGVGDKVSLVLVPALVACGARVPMISGRGLGHTGGTLDKLEAIPGFTTQLSISRLRSALQGAGAFIAAQTEELVPADRRLYALRDATGLVASTPLIASSILSKKLAEGLGALVLDVKYGSGAMLPGREEGAHLATTMLHMANCFGLRTTAFQTAMDQPLGRAIGHSIEVAEAIDCLRGGGPEDLRELTLTLGGALLTAVGLSADETQGQAALGEALDDGRAQDAFVRMIRAQGGDPRVVDDTRHLPRAVGLSVWCSPATGVLDLADCRELGLALADLGGARHEGGAPLDPSVGIRWLRRVGEEVQAGDALAEILHQDGRGLAKAEARLTRAVTFDTGRAPDPLVLRRLDPAMP